MKFAANDLAFPPVSVDIFIVLLYAGVRFLFFSFSVWSSMRLLEGEGKLFIPILIRFCGKMTSLKSVVGGGKGKEQVLRWIAQRM